MPFSGLSNLPRAFYAALRGNHPTKAESHDCHQTYVAVQRLIHNSSRHQPQGWNTSSEYVTTRASSIFSPGIHSICSVAQRCWRLAKSLLCELNAPERPRKGRDGLMDCLVRPADEDFREQHSKDANTQCDH
jgi:hypothetical protein